MKVLFLRHEYDSPSRYGDREQRNVKPTQVVGDNNKRTLRQINGPVLYLAVTEDRQQKSYRASADIVQTQAQSASLAKTTICPSAFPGGSPSVDRDGIISLLHSLPVFEFRGSLLCKGFECLFVILGTGGYGNTSHGEGQSCFQVHSQSLIYL